MQAIEMILPLPPSVNQAYCIVGRRKRLTPKARSWYKIAADMIFVNKLLRGIPKDLCFFPQEMQLKTSVVFRFPDNRRRDQSNYIKLLYDAFVKGLIIPDDRQIKEEHIVSEIIKGERQVYIKIEGIDKDV